MAKASAMILCDTNILIEFYRANLGVVKVLEEIGVNNLALSAITQAELYVGARNKTELQQIRNHLSLLTVYHVTLPISGTFLELMEAYALSHSLSIPDGLIAATALQHQAALYTLNLKDFRFIPNLSLYSHPPAP